MFSTSTLQKIYDNLLEIVFYYGPKLLGALFIWIVGLWVIKLIVRALQLLFDRSKTDASLKSFLLSLVSIGLKLLLGISALGMLGIEMTSFIALLGAAGLAFGMAMSGTLQNLAGGVILLIFKPFKVGDVLEAQGYTGSVKEIGIFNTIMNTPDNKTIIIPNGGLSSGSMVNYSTEPTRRVDFTLGIGYGDDYDKAKAVMEKFIAEDARILKDPAHFIGLHTLADSSVNLAVRVWVNAADYWGVYFDMNEKIYKNFGNEGLNIPFPQMDVHVHNVK